jgi:SAM-dependent methyltransferase
MSFDANGPNAQQIAYWSEITGPRWVALQVALDSQIAPLGLEAMARADIGEGNRVLDVGCGCGQTLLQLGECVGATGRILGVDISDVMLARATERVSSSGLAWVETRRADAQTCDFAADAFDHVFSRFGIMFFADPARAFANLRRALAPGGRITFVCWQALAANAWMQLPMRAAAQHVSLAPPASPGAPGPFSLAEASHTRALLEAAGFSAVQHVGLERDLLLGKDLAAASALCLQMGPAGAALRLATERGESVDRPALRSSIEAALAPFLHDDGVRMPSACWIVQAQA